RSPYVSAKKSHKLQHTTFSEDHQKKNVYCVCVERTRANSPNKYFHIHFSPLHVIHSYQCESINTNTTLTVMCFCFISQLIYFIIPDSRCPFVNIPHCICLKHTEVLSNQKENQLSLGYYLTNTFQTQC